MKLKIRTGIFAVLGIILIFSFPLVAQGQGEEDYTFRNTRWGMSESEVIALEGDPDVKYDVDPKFTSGFDRFIGYKNLNKGGLRTLLAYSFAENQLVSSTYNLKETHSSRSRYEEDYKEMKKSLTDEYGQPQFNKEEFAGDFVTVWETEETRVRMILKEDDDGKINHQIIYKSKELQDLMKKTRRAHWSENAKEAVAQGKIMLGMTKEQVKASWGEPDDINRTVTEYGTREQWVYGGAPNAKYLYFEDGELTAWQD